jgi:hypothetical protein
MLMLVVNLFRPRRRRAKSSWFFIIVKDDMRMGRQKRATIKTG